MLQRVYNYFSGNDGAQNNSEYAVQAADASARFLHSSLVPGREAIQQHSFPCRTRKDCIFWTSVIGMWIIAIGSAVSIFILFTLGNHFKQDGECPEVTPLPSKFTLRNDIINQWSGSYLSVEPDLQIKLLQSCPTWSPEADIFYNQEFISQSHIPSLFLRARRYQRFHIRDCHGNRFATFEKSHKTDRIRVNGTKAKLALKINGTIRAHAHVKKFIGARITLLDNDGVVLASLIRKDIQIPRTWEVTISNSTNIATDPRILLAVLGRYSFMKEDTCNQVVRTWFYIVVITSIFFVSLLLFGHIRRRRSRRRNRVQNRNRRPNRRPGRSSQSN